MNINNCTKQFEYKHIFTHKKTLSNELKYELIFTVNV